MHHFQIVVTTVLTTLIALAIAAVAAWSLAPPLARAAVELHRAGEFGTDGPCTHFDERHTRLVRAHLTAALDLTGAQAAALEPAIAVIEAWRADIVAACANLRLDSVDDHLDALQTMLARTGSALADLKTAFGPFEATLTQEQRDDLAAMIHHRHDREGPHAH